jgi:DNA-directed RNA polymerase specialized sigma24 family protein
MPEPNEPPEELLQLLAAARALGAAPDALALREFLPRLRNMARQHSPPESALRAMIDSEALLQECLLQLVRNIYQFRIGSWPEFLTFVHAILAQWQMQPARRNQVRAGELGAKPPHESLPSNQATPSVDIKAQDDRARRRQPIAGLVEPYRLALQPRLDGLDNAAIAAHRGITANALRERLSRAVRNPVRPASLNPLHPEHPRWPMPNVAVRPHPRTAYRGPLPQTHEEHMAAPCLPAACGNSRVRRSRIQRGHHRLSRIQAVLRLVAHPSHPRPRPHHGSDDPGAVSAPHFR